MRILLLILIAGTLSALELSEMPAYKKRAAAASSPALTPSSIEGLGPLYSVRRTYRVRFYIPPINYANYYNLETRKGRADYFRSQWGLISDLYTPVAPIVDDQPVFRQVESNPVRDSQGSHYNRQWKPAATQEARDSQLESIRAEKSLLKAKLKAMKGR